MGKAIGIDAQRSIALVLCVPAGEPGYDGCTGKIARRNRSKDFVKFGIRRRVIGYSKLGIYGLNCNIGIVDHLTDRRQERLRIFARQHADIEIRPGLG